MTQEILQDIFHNIFKIPLNCIVPRQGNWFNPQASLNLEEKPMTWLAYAITNDEPITTPGYDTDVDDEGELFEVIITQNITTIELEIIGTRAETCAQSVQLWSYRSDVEEQFLRINGQFMTTDCVIKPFDYKQEGLNTIKGQFISFKIARKALTPTGAIRLDSSYSVEIGGQE